MLTKGQKISLAAKKRYKDKTKHPMYGKSHSKEAKIKMSKKAKKRVGKKSSNWKGGRIISGGYVYIYTPDHPNKTKDNYVCEHRLVMEKHLNRFLDKKEVVHHINHDTKDNRIENLILFSDNGIHTISEHVKRDPKTGRFI